MSDEPFIERIFESGEDIITARFLQPALAPGGEYQCRWAIVWPDRVQQRYACGVDGVQALMLAMKSVHSELMESNLYKSGKLTYADQYDLDLPPGWGEGQLYVPPERKGS
ncbi:hypothetical protein NDN01_14055 [Sphingomonas sp. QA11]|uniref:DUF6968 family protein n=1 Tax=Sphingomonas sp. QA11 TaxID=2950605 RepID=UPI00234A82DA|nr:hypothetical protein [Sphingomonas sp. QA11]WCM25195.1 hypothetical protein NDN01_14055 [Sphingomonas sp. QA11]